MADITSSIRDALKVLPQLPAGEATSTPDLRAIYTASTHEGALDPLREIVVGDRGVGKSFWASVLVNSASRTAIANIYPNIGLGKTSIALGFAESLSRGEYPSMRVLRPLAAKVDATSIWHAVILNSFPDRFRPEGWSDWKWEQRCIWVDKQPEEAEAIFSRFDAALRSNDRRHIVIFDALDRLGQDWSTIRQLMKALLITVLDMRSYENIGLKVFIRPDMEEDKEIWLIRDGSKLKQNSVDLTWTHRDLYGFLWHWLSTHEASRDIFRALVKDETGITLKTPTSEQLVVIDPSLAEDESVQTAILSRIAGPFMGSNKKKGVTYTWIPRHLSDAKSRVSLRSFIVAFREAARVTPATAANALMPTSIKTGVQAASIVRVEQLREDYPWINDVIEPLGGLRTPNTIGAFRNRWEEEKTIQKILLEGSPGPNYLIPVQLEGISSADDAVYDRLLDALMNIAVIERRDDGRINMPDLFQIASGLLRKGGIRPAA